jgi:hypothetical protein
LLIALPHALSAQTTERRESPVTWGPVGLTPQISVRNVGIDTNPLHQGQGGRPDMTALVVPSLDSVIPIGRGEITGRTSLEWSFFNRTRDDRALTLSHVGRARLKSRRFEPYVTAGDLRTAQRPNLEIDLRVAQRTTIVGVGAVWPVDDKLRLEFESGRSALAFGRNSHDERSIASLLERRVEHATVAAEFVLAPRASLAVRTTIERDRFRISRVRDANSVTFVPAATIRFAAGSGTIAVGYRHLDVLGAGVPDFNGLIGHAETSHALRAGTRLSLRAHRDVDYSVELTQPYFVAQGGSLAVTQALGAGWEATARIGRTLLLYRDFVDRTQSAARSGRRVDAVDVCALEIGRRVAAHTWIGLDVEHAARHAGVPGRDYRGLRLGMALSYGKQ